MRKQMIVWSILLCLLLGGCSGKSVKEKLEEFYPEGTITVNEDDFYVVTTPIDTEDFDRECFEGVAQGYKPVTSLEKLLFNHQSDHYVIVRGRRVGGVTQQTQFEKSGRNIAAEAFFTVEITAVHHNLRDKKIPDKIKVLEAPVILPHGKERVRYSQPAPVPKEGEEYFFVLETISRAEEVYYGYYNPLLADLKIDDGLYTAKKLTSAQKLTLDMMKTYLQ